MAEKKVDTGPSLTKFQVTISFEMDEEFMSLVPEHRVYINELINKAIIDNYTVSIESMRSWIVINAHNKEEVKTILQHSPLYKYWMYEIDEIYVFDGQSYRPPALQMN